MIPDTICVWTNRILIIFFFVNNITIINCKKNQTFTIEFAKKLLIIYPLIAKNKIK
jgi:hypothetical protein